jgi:hypothetical protein
VDAQRRQMGRIIASLRKALKAGDAQSFADELEKRASADLLVAIREQKLLTKAPQSLRPQVAVALKSAAKRVLRESEASQFIAYVDFIFVWERAHANASERLSVVLRVLPQMTLGQLLAVSDEVLTQLLAHLPGHPPPKNRSVADYERRLHDLNGSANDTVYAVLRALNEASRTVLKPGRERLGRSKRDQARRRLKKASQITAELNGLDSLLDWVTYGDLVVSEMGSGSQPQVRFDYTDPRRSLLRALAIRRDIVLNLNRARAPRYVREMLKASETSLLEFAIDHYAGLVGVDVQTVDSTRLFDESAAVLIFVSAEDDLLVAGAGSVADGRPATYYLSAMSLQWFELAAAAVRRSLPRGRRHILAAPVVPVQDIQAAIERGGGKRVGEAIEGLSSVLPVRSHHDLVRRPFVRAEVDEVYCLPSGGGLWTATVRETLLLGGSLGDAYGRMWEAFYSESFEESAWCVIGRGLKLRRNAKTATDVDLLLKREDLLLVVQVKALIGSSVTIYDHWRNRQTVEWGCRQAALAAEFIRSDSQWLVSVAGARTAGEIRQVQPLVLTTIDAFDGWRFEGVPVIGEGGRKAITKGAKVDYTDPSGAVVSTRHITRPEELSTERILWTLDNPIELLIAPEGLSVWHKEVTFAGLRALLPEFDQRETVESFPAAIERD